MLKRHKNNLNTIGGVSCVSLLLLMFSLVNPLTNDSANALEDMTDDNNDANIELYTDPIDSTMNISFSPLAGTATAPIGSPTKFQVTATVDVQNSGGYTIYFGSNNQNLTRNGGSEVIGPISGSVDFLAMENNTWGYAVEEGNTVADNAMYTAVPGSVRGRAIYTNNSTNIASDSKTYTLSFAARIGTDKPAGTYSNQVTMSVVSSPLVVSAFGGITELQAMTSAICSAATIGDEAQLKDTRDDKYYWIGKLADGKCWMTQNLDLDLNPSTLPLMPETSDVSEKWTPGDAGKNPAYTATIASSETVYADNTGQRSWDLGDYRITNPTASYGCGSGNADIAACEGTDNNRFTPYNTPTTATGEENAHYIVGNYYQWCAATAGCSDGINIGVDLTSGEATDSICPKGWRLPTNSDSKIGSFSNLVSVGGIGLDVPKLTSSPYYFVRGGLVIQGTSNLSSYAGDNGHYWSSTAVDGNRSYLLYFFGAGNINPFDYTGRQTGFSVRCLAR